MKPKLILVEGLPGSGKTTIAQMVSNYFNEMDHPHSLFLEGNLDHPADYDKVSYFTFEEYEPVKKYFESWAAYKENGVFVHYGKHWDEINSTLSKELRDTLFQHDIYELPLDLNKELITSRWANFAEQVKNEETTYIFDCAFLQNPLTISMIKYGADAEYNETYVKELEELIKPLNPALIYVDQRDSKFAFQKAFDERPKEWADGFLDYYTNQGYGKMNGLQGFDGTIEVLEARKQLEFKIVNRLDIDRYIIDNSDFSMEKSRGWVKNTLDYYFTNSHLHK